MKKHVLFSALSLAIVSGCAKGANSIVPVSIPVAAYSNLNCQELGQEFIKEQESVAFLSKKQNEAAIGDAIGVALIGVPTASITGHDREGKLAVSKGKVLTIESTMKSKSCASTETVVSEETPAPTVIEAEAPTTPTVVQ